MSAQEKANTTVDDETTMNEENHQELQEEHQTEANAEQAAADDSADTEAADDSLEAKLARAEAKAAENWDHFVRTKAEMDNLRRRNAKDVENAHKYGIEKLVNQLLPVVDGMELGLAVEGASAESLREGMELTMKMMQKMMENLGIEEINPINEKFNPEKHQAMSLQPSADVEPNTVIAVMQKGYSLNDRLIRPAMVMVSKAVDQETQ
jgi:molecular chaperone GrpE